MQFGVSSDGLTQASASLYLPWVIKNRLQGIEFITGK